VDQHSNGRREPRASAAVQRPCPSTVREPPGPSCLNPFASASR
jgi:hypothetical protein